MVKPIRTLARLFVRGCDKKDGIIIGVAMKGSRDVLKPETIYELREVLGTIQLIEIGPALCENKPRAPGYGVELSRLVEENMFYLTKAEWKEICKHSEAGDKKTLAALKNRKK